MYTVIPLIALFILLSNTGDADCKYFVPDYVQKCNTKSADEALHKCMRANVDIFQSHLAEGIPEMKIPPLDPLALERITLDMPNIQTTYTNCTVLGASNFQVIQTGFDRQEMGISMDVLFPFLRIVSNYSVHGKLLLFELNSNGHCWNNITNMYAHIQLKYKRREENGKTFLDFNDNKRNSLKLVFTDNPVFYFENLFESEELTRNTNAVINDNIKEVLKEFKPIIEDVISSFVFSTIQKIFNMFSIDELFVNE